MKKLLSAAAFLALVAVFFAFDLDRFLTLETLKARHDELSTLYQAKPWQVIAVFSLLYVAVATLPLPGAIIMTLAGGAIFGLAAGTVIVSFASSIGALVAFLASRYLLRDTVRRHFGDRLNAVNEGFARDGVFYLFTLRVVPVLPFFLVNLLMGLTPMRGANYYLISQLGMLPGTVVYVNAGTQLASIQKLADILSPVLLVSFAALGVFPLLARAFVHGLRRRRVYARWRRPRRFERNLVVIGAGAAGLVTAYVAAMVRARVTLIEAHRMGGDCLNYGCVPSKTLIRSARLAHEMRHAGRFGLSPVSPQVDFRAVMARVREAIHAIEPHDSVARYAGLGVEVLQGRARLIDPWTVQVAMHDGSTRRLTARSIVIAAGARPVVPDLPGLEETGYLTSDTLWDALATAERPPQRLVVLGGGPIGCELAQAFARLGSQVVQVESQPRLLQREDEDVSALVRTSLEAEGVEVLTGCRALRCERPDGRKAIILAHDTGERRIEFDALLVAIGRAPRLAGYGLEELGIPVERTVVTNEYLQTCYPNIYAAGDVAGPYQFTHTAAHMGWYAAVNTLFGDLRKLKVDYSVVPATTFTSPEVARVGLNEREAAEHGIVFEVTRFSLAELDRAITDGATTGFVKILTPPGKGRILGVTIVGEHAGELLAEYALAMRNGLGLQKVLRTLHSYPTLAEANKYAAGEWRRAHVPQRLLGWLARYHAWKLG